MEKLTPKEIRINQIRRSNTLHKKLERIITRTWWENGKRIPDVFDIYCEAVKYEAKLLRYDAHLDKNPFINGAEYKSLVKMSDNRLKRHLLKLSRQS